jgi:Zn-finger nucleic acid-binding protein
MSWNSTARCKMKCPRCDKALKTRTIETVEIDECVGCNGIWFDQDELRKAKDETNPDLNWMDFELWKHQDRFHVAAKPIKCPKCKEEMVAIDYDKTKVEIDYCIECKGVWLDAGEFEKIIDALTEELSTKSASEYVKDTLEEAKNIITGSEPSISEWKDFLTVLRMLEYRILSENPRVAKALTDIQVTSPFR